MSSYRVFLVDDDNHYARLVTFRLEKDTEYEIEAFSSGTALFEHLNEEGEVPDAVLLDIMMPGMSGLEVLERLQKEHPQLPVIMISAQGVIETATQAIKMGAYDYVSKGQDEIAKLKSTLGNALEEVRLHRELDALRDEVEERYGMGQLVGESEPMQEVYRLVRKAVRANITVAVQGESGTGKELVAKAIHYNSDRDGPFVEVNCAAVPSELMESTFFGHEKGAFTDAKKQRIGKFEQADGGTIFLDEVGEMSLDLQAKLLRALQNRTIQRVGGNEKIRFDARVICATNRDVMPMIEEGTFREDLYYRLFQFPISLPPLRERGKDLLLLARHFRDAYLSDHPDLPSKTLSADARRALLDYSWPGNVRELKSAVERALLIAEGEYIEPDDLMLQRDGQSITPWKQRRTAPSPSPPHAINVNGSGGDGAVALGTDAESISTLEDLKRRAVKRAYRLCDGNATAAAEELDIGRATMYRLLDKYDLKD